MNTKFIDFEGIHGCGKSTTAWILNDNLIDSGINSQVFLEADLDNPYENPCDFRFMSVLTEKELNQLKNEFPTQIQRITTFSKKIDDYYMLYYPNFNDYLDLKNKLMDYQVYEGRFNYNDFKMLMKKRITDFVEEAVQNDEVYIFESVLFQHIINELLRFTNSNPEMISELIAEIIDILRPLNPIIFHLYTDDIKGIIDKIASERLSDNYDLYPDWIDFMIEYVKNSDYGLHNNVCDKNGLLEYFYKRANIEKQAFNTLDIQKYIVDIQKVSRDSLNAMVYDIVMKNQ